MINRLLRFILAIVACTAIVSIGSTQIVLNSVSSFGLEVDLATRLSSTFSDLLGIGPVLLAIVTVTYLVGFIVAYLLSKLALSHHTWGIIAGLTALPSAVLLMNYALDLEIFFMTSVLSGWLVLIVASLVGSLIFHRTAPGA